MFILLETYNFPKIILFRHEQYHFQKDLGAQLKLSGELSVVYSISSRNSSVAHLSLHPEHIPEQPKHSLSSPREDS